MTATTAAAAITTTAAAAGSCIYGAPGVLLTITATSI
jgi:hypothetical protein